MWRSTNKQDETNESWGGWRMFPIEHPNVDMSRFTNYFNPDTGTYITRNAPKLNAEKANEELQKFRNPLNTFAPVRVSEECGQ